MNTGIVHDYIYIGATNPGEIAEVARGSKTLLKST